MGNRVKVVENDGRTVEYDYDNLYRLTEEKITDAVAGNKTITYTFDAVGNRLQRIDSVEGTTTYTYNNNDRLLQETLGGNVTQYQYDEEGNLTAKVENGTTTTAYEWNAKGELTAVEVTENGETGRIEFEYDHNGIRVAINVDGEETRFLIDNNQQEYAQVIEEYQTNGTVNTTYTHGWDLISQDNGTNRIYYQVDGLGSTRLMTDNNEAIVVEYDYDAYGNLTRKVGDADNNYLFAGEQFDDSVDGYYLRARYYDPNTGHFASVDPFEGYNNLPVTLHDYIYGANNPVNAIDPSGEVALFEYQGIINLTVSGEAGEQYGATIGMLLGFGLTTLVAAGEILGGTKSYDDVIKNTEKIMQEIIGGLGGFNNVPGNLSPFDVKGFFKGFTDGYTGSVTANLEINDKVLKPILKGIDITLIPGSSNGGIKNGLIAGINYLKAVLPRF